MCCEVFLNMNSLLGWEILLLDFTLIGVKLFEHAYVMVFAGLFGRKWLVPPTCLLGISSLSWNYTEIKKWFVELVPTWSMLTWEFKPGNEGTVLNCFKNWLNFVSSCRMSSMRGKKKKNNLEIFFRLESPVLDTWNTVFCVWRREDDEWLFWSRFSWNP